MAFRMIRGAAPELSAALRSLDESIAVEFAGTIGIGGSLRATVTLPWGPRGGCFDPLVTLARPLYPGGLSPLLGSVVVEGGLTLPVGRHTRSVPLTFPHDSDDNPGLILGGRGVRRLRGALRASGSLDLRVPLGRGSRRGRLAMAGGDLTWRFWRPGLEVSAGVLGVRQDGGTVAPRKHAALLVVGVAGAARGFPPGKWWWRLEAESRVLGEASRGLRLSAGRRFHGR
ncbi:MAG: hypothetical protein QF904_05870 [Gemmatimonadota bacterium]|nr:hypothetical protein [Gemmatimonadota bacterium]